MNGKTDSDYALEMGQWVGKRCLHRVQLGHSIPKYVKKFLDDADGLGNPPDGQTEATYPITIWLEWTIEDPDWPDM